VRVFTVIPGLKGVAALQCGDDHCGAVTNSGDLYCWGRGDCGQLGLGDERSQSRPTQLRGFKVVHPDRTLRRHKRNTPNTRPIVQELEKKAPAHKGWPSSFFKPHTKS
jgi:E3 ubiquitin-protein ligase HERC3